MSTNDPKLSDRHMPSLRRANDADNEPVPWSEEHLAKYPHIPEPLRAVIGAYTHTEGWKTGLNCIHNECVGTDTTGHDLYRSYMLLCNAQVTSAGDTNVPSGKPNLTTTQIGIDWFVNIGDLNIFFGRLNGTFGLPEDK